MNYKKIYIYKYIFSMNEIIISCPHCNQLSIIKINELNCRIFRCGVYKYNFVQIPPHLDKLSCELLVNNNLIYGCSKPFKIDNDYKTIECDYI